jgi:hypothetical protein
MENIKNVILGVLVVAVLFLGAKVSGLSSSLGAASGYAHYQMESFLQGVSAGARDQFSVSNTGVLTTSGAITTTSALTSGAFSATTGAFSSTLDVTGATEVGLFTQGGGVLSTSTVSTAMIPTAATFNYGLIQITPNTADLTYTFPATSTMSAMIPNAGDSRTVMVYNATTTAGIDVIFAAGTGMEIKGTGSTPLTIDEASMGTLTFVRKANSDILVLVNAAVAD